MGLTQLPRCLYLKPSAPHESLLLCSNQNELWPCRTWSKSDNSTKNRGKSIIADSKDLNFFIGCDMSTKEYSPSWLICRSGTCSLNPLNLILGPAFILIPSWNPLGTRVQLSPVMSFVVTSTTFPPPVFRHWNPPGCILSCPGFCGPKTINDHQNRKNQSGLAYSLPFGNLKP